MSQLNKARYLQFMKQAKGMRLSEVHVTRQEKKRHVVLKYNGKAHKTKNRLTGEWQIAKEEREEAAITEDIKSFLAELRKHFFVHRGQGLEGETFADESMEAKATPIKNES